MLQNITLLQLYVYYALLDLFFEKFLGSQVYVFKEVGA